MKFENKEFYIRVLITIIKHHIYQNNFVRKISKELFP